APTARIARCRLRHRRTAGRREKDPGSRRGLRRRERVSTFAFTVESRFPREIAERLGRDIAVRRGDYYGAEVMRRLALDEGAVRVGTVPYNMADEVDRLLGELDERTAAVRDDPSPRS